MLECIESRTRLDTRVRTLFLDYANFMPVYLRWSLACEPPKGKALLRAMNKASGTSAELKK